MTPSNIEDQRALALVLAEDIFGTVHFITQGKEAEGYAEVWHCKSGAVIKLKFEPTDGIDRFGNPAIEMWVHALNTSDDQGRHYIRRWQESCAGVSWSPIAEGAAA